jgi:hypothetical protein
MKPFSKVAAALITGFYYDLYSLQYYRKDGPSNLNLDLNNAAERWDDGSFLWGFLKWKVSGHRIPAGYRNTMYIILMNVISAALTFT